MSSYDARAAVYDWLMPVELLAPLGSAEAFAGIVDLEPGRACWTARAAGLEPTTTTYSDEGSRYLVTARRAA